MGCCEVVGEKKKKRPKYDEWEVKSFMRTIQEAGEIRAIKEKLKAIKKLFPKYFKEKKAEVKSLDDLKKLIDKEDSGE